MNTMIEDAQRAEELPEVREMIERLSKHGLGVFLPHMHLEGGGFAPLSKSVVQIEKDLQVRFVHRDDPVVEDAVPVGWAWDEGEARVIASCYCCKGPH